MSKFTAPKPILRLKATSTAPELTREKLDEYGRALDRIADDEARTAAFHLLRFARDVTRQEK